LKQFFFLNLHFKFEREMKGLATFLLVFLSTQAALAANSKVLELSEANFDSTIASQPLTLVEFFAPWCGHCKALAPEYDAASLSLEGKNAGVLAKVDCTVERDLCSRFDVQGFPTIKLFRNDGSDPSEYDGARKAEAITKFMIKQNAPAVTELADAEALKNFATDEDVKLILFADSEVESYTKTASSLRNEFSFGVVKGNDALKSEYKVSQTPAVVMLRNFDEGAVTYGGDLSSENAKEDLTSWIRAQSFPLIGEIGPENYAKYLDRGFNFVWIFIDFDNDDQKKIVQDITSVAAEFRNQLSFVKLDGIKWAEHAKSFGLSGNTPGVVIEDRSKRRNFVFPEDSTLTRTSFHDFVDGVLKGTIAATVKSEPIPEKNDGPVKVVVGHTFNDIVLDNTKDVFVEFYAPWCGHCKSLAPKYEQLGKMFKDDSTVVIAKIDATANDSPADIQGFPTLILYPAGDKENPVNYEGERSAKAMAAFVNRHGKAGGRPVKGADDEDAEDHSGHDHSHGDHGHAHEHEHEEL